MEYLTEFLGHDEIHLLINWCNTDCRGSGNIECRIHVLHMWCSIHCSWNGRNTHWRIVVGQQSFGKYFDDQRDRLEKAMQNKNTQLNSEWREEYDKRQREKKEQRMKKELEECSDKGVEISQECKEYYQTKYK